MRPIADVLAEIEPWQRAASLTYEPLDGGLTNHTYKVVVDGRIYVLRINGQQNECLGLDRALEIEVIQQAESLGFGPKVFSVDNQRDYLITEYQAAPALSAELARQPDMLQRMAETLRAVHRMPAPTQRQCNPFHLIRAYLQGAQNAGITVPERLNPHLQRLDEIERRRRVDPAYGQCYCHNDYFHFHILCDDRLTVLDWELSGYGDPFFDVATMPYAIGFTPDEEEYWLVSYFGTCDQAKRDTLKDMKFVGLVREISWALLHVALEPNPINHHMDYGAFAFQVIQMLDDGRLSFGESSS